MLKEWDGKMNIFVIESSPHKKGSSNLLVEQFIRGAKEAGHQVEVFDAADAKINPCIGCDSCGMSRDCCQKDDMVKVRKKVLSADMVVFVTPLYYFGMSAQLKLVIDRFYSFNSQLSSKKLKTALIAAAWNSGSVAMSFLKAHYQGLCDYLNFKDQGMVLGTGCGTVAMTHNSRYMKKAYELGKNLS